MLTFFPSTANEPPVTGQISANGDTITLGDMTDVSGYDPTWTNTAQFIYAVCNAGSAGACQ